MALTPPIKKLLDAIAQALAEEDLKAILASEGVGKEGNASGKLPSAPVGPPSSEKQTPGNEGEPG